MPDLLTRNENIGQLVHDVGNAVSTTGQRLKDGVTNNRDEMLILVGTMLFVIAMAMLGALLISVG